MNLDDRARQASAQLNAAVAQRPLGAGVPRPRPQRMRLALAAGSVVAVAVAGFVVLRDTDPARDQSVTAADRPGPPGEPAPPPETAPAPPPETAPATPPETALPPESDVPAGWARCTDPDAGYSLGHPEDWYSISELPPDAVDDRVEVGPCSFFDPLPFEIHYASEWPTTALVVSPAAGDYDQMSTRPEGAPEEGILLWEEKSVQGHRAVRVEREFTGEGLYPAGLRHYSWIIDRHGEAFVVGGFWRSPETISRSEQNAVVDGAVETLRFDDGGSA